MKQVRRGCKEQGLCAESPPRARPTRARTRCPLAVALTPPACERLPASPSPARQNNPPDMAAPTRRPSRRRPPPRLMLLTATAAALLALAAAAAADPPSSSSPAQLPPPYPPLPPPDANANATASASSSPPPPFSFAPEIGTGPGGVVYGTVQIVAVHGPMVPGTEVEHEHQPFVSVRGTGEMRRLLFPPQRAAESGGGSGGGNEARVPPTGSLVMVKAAPMSRCVKPGTPVDGNPVCVHAMMAHECESSCTARPAGRVREEKKTGAKRPRRLTPLRPPKIPPQPTTSNSRRRQRIRRGPTARRSHRQGHRLFARRLRVGPRRRRPRHRARPLRRHAQCLPLHRPGNDACLQLWCRQFHTCWRGGGGAARRAPAVQRLYTQRHVLRQQDVPVQR